ncbi:MAG: AAA family ATPase [Candidatus Kariarchaeaceae archaeon]|jgi:DNA repair protein RadB
MESIQENPENYDFDTPSELKVPLIKHDKRDVFEYQGKKYLVSPYINEFLVEAGIVNIREFRSIYRELELKGVQSFDDLLDVTKSQLLQFESVSPVNAVKIFTHIVLTKYKGPFLLSMEDLDKLESEYYFLEFVKELDTVLFKYNIGKSGLRSKSLIEICGPEDVGKTLWCLTATCNMLHVGKRVAYIDSEGGFSLQRIQQIGSKSDLSKRSITDNVILSQIDSFDELDLVIDQLSSTIKKQNLGMIVIDSIMQLLQNTYPVDQHLDWLAVRQLHLRKTMRRLRSIARNHNLIIIYTNHTRESRVTITQGLHEDIIDDQDDLKTIINLLKRIVRKELPMGGNTLAHSSDIRIYLNRTQENPSVMRASIENSSYLPNVSANYMITPNGIQAILNNKEVISNETMIKLNDLLG